MTKTPPVNEYHRAREAELELELKIDALTDKTAEMMRARIDARKSGRMEEADALDKEYEALKSELRALRLQG